MLFEAHPQRYLKKLSRLPIALGVLNRAQQFGFKPEYGMKAMLVVMTH